MTQKEENTNVPLKLPLLPLRGIVVFPTMVVPLDVGRPKSIAAIEQATMGDNRILLVAQKDSKLEDPQADELYETGVIAEVKQLLRLPGNNSVRVLVEGKERAGLEAIVEEEPCLVAQAQLLETETDTDPLELEALRRICLDYFQRYVKWSKKLPPEVFSSVETVEDPGLLSDLIASHLTVKVPHRQQLLELADSGQRLQALAGILSRELELLELENKIQGRVRKQMERIQKEYFLREQLKAIQKELGEGDDREEELAEYRKKMEKARLPKAVQKKAEKELKRLSKMPTMSAEAVVVRTYLDCLLDLPWHKKTRDRLDLKLAQQILDEDHWGLEKVKERIIEYLAVRKLTGKAKGQILCLVGPPGVGKTSLARSIARAMERKFVRFSLGGVRDEAEIRGHRRTYIGSMPGKIISSMRQAGSINPVLLLDEVDKMNSDFRGDPASALLEVLDSEQNSNFADHYLEVPYDLSGVFFLTTANVAANIPRPLLDRMELIELPGYTEEEKLQIAKRHLLPKQLVAHGLKKEQLEISDKILVEVIQSYTREAGVRNLERTVATLCRKAAKEIIEGKEKIKLTTRTKLSSYLGPIKYRHGQKDTTDEVGVATGLAWTEMGGELLKIEVTVVPGKGNLLLTGKLGDVMRESAQASFSFVRSRAEELGVDPDFYEKCDVHIHVPEGAIPKDGPSAGITITTALASALSGRPVSSKVAMTGEVTLRGKVLPIGGLREKVLAAHRAGIRTIILPQENRKDAEEIPAKIRKQMKLVYAEHMDQVLGKALAYPLPTLKEVSAAEEMTQYLA
jgi:ATP-dependent Lon protease